MSTCLNFGKAKINTIHHVYSKAKTSRRSENEELQGISIMAIDFYCNVGVMRRNPLEYREKTEPDMARIFFLFYAFSSWKIWFHSSSVRASTGAESTPPSIPNENSLG